MFSRFIYSQPKLDSGGTTFFLIFRHSRREIALATNGNAFPDFCFRKYIKLNMFLGKHGTMNDLVCCYRKSGVGCTFFFCLLLVSLCVFSSCDDKSTRREEEKEEEEVFMGAKGGKVELRRILQIWACGEKGFRLKKALGSFGILLKQ